MKKSSFKLLIFVLLVSCSLFLVGCEKVENTTWILQSIRVEDSADAVTKASATYVESLLKTAEYTMKFEKNGKCLFSITDQSREGTYSQSGQSISITVNNEIFKARINNSKLTMSNEKITFIFKKSE